MLRSEETEGESSEEVLEASQGRTRSQLMSDSTQEQPTVNPEATKGPQPTALGSMLQKMDGGESKANLQDWPVA